jgi:hypothetical protein
MKTDNTHNPTKESFPSTYQCISSENNWVLFLFAGHIITNMTFGVADESKSKTEIKL